MPIQKTAKPTPSKRQSRWRKAVLAAASTVITVALLEGGYRLYLLSASDEVAPTRTLYAVSECMYELDRDLGYSYLPASAVAVRTGGSGVADVWPCVVNRHGQIGDPTIADGWQAASQRILVAGDSFTANPNFGGIGWPDGLHSFLRGNGASVAVQNHGRDGYGLLQMLTMAATRTRELSPTVVVIAYILDDLTRDRFWRTSYDDGSYRRLFVTTVPTASPAPSERAELALLNPAVASLSIGDKAPFLGQQYLLLSSPTRELHRNALASFGHSVLLGKLLHGDPFAGIHPPARNPRHGLDQFEADEKFMEDVAALVACNVPIALVQLPTCEELEAGEYSSDARTRKLQASLLACLKGATVIDLMEHLKEPSEGWRSWFLYPRNGHPAQLGANMFGHAVGQALVTCGLVNRD